MTNPDRDLRPDIELVGIDPNSEDQKCCGVWVEKDSGDMLVRGKKETNPLILARLEVDAGSGIDEVVVRIPNRMRGQMAQAASGDYEEGLIGHGEIDFLDVLRTARYSAIHLESRDTYDPNTPAFVDWLSGGSGRSDRSRWTGLVKELVGRGVRMRRARVVSSPPTQYTRWLHMVTDVNIEAGEDVRWLVRDDAPDLLVPAADYWLIDNRLICFNTCTGDGAHNKDHYSNDPDVLGRTLLEFERVWDRAMPHAEFSFPD